MRQDDDRETIPKVFRLPRYLAGELEDVVHYLKKVTKPADKKNGWTQNQVVCEALRVWIIGAKEKLGLGENK
jgi:hypothetical protein